MLQFYTLVCPHVEYCVSAWSPYYEKDKALLERIQHRFTRMIPGFKQLPYESRLLRLQLWTLEERRHRADLLEVFKMYSGSTLVSFHQFFTLSQVQHHLRSSSRRQQAGRAATATLIAPSSQRR